MIVDLKKLTHALTVQRLGSFSKAADQLGLTQPTLSRSIAALESIWGARIFERNRSGVVATRIGAEMLQEAAQLLGFARTLDRNMELRAAARTGSLAFGMSGLPSSIFLPSVLSMFMETAPELKVTTVTEPLPSLLGQLKDDVIEFAVFSEAEAPEDASLAFEKIGKIPLGFIVRSSHPLAGVEAVAWDQLKSHSLACSSYARIRTIPINPTIICDDFGVAKELVLNSDAIWLSSPLALRSEIEKGYACELKVPVLGRLHVHLWIAFPQNRLSSPAAKTMLSYLKSRAAAEIPLGGGAV
jgi:LysR family pca operon transcriptional activator